MVSATLYKPPPNSIYVSNNGADSNPGTQIRPYRTIVKAVSAAQNGSTIVVRRGIYRESIPPISKRINLQPFPGEEVWIKGSIIEEDWTLVGDYWVSSARDYVFCNDCFHPDNIDPAYPLAGWPEQVFVDGKPLTQVADKQDVVEGSFFVDRQNNWIVIGDNPTGKLIEISAHKTALEIEKGAERSKIRGLGFAHYSPVARPGSSGAIKIDAQGVEFTSNTIAWSAVKGLEVFAHDVAIHDNTFIYNGMMGLGTWNADGLFVTGNRFSYNNTEHFAVTGPVSEAAGAKITSSKGISIIGNTFEDNMGNGLWMDINVSDALILRNIIRDNKRHGIFYELSSFGRIISNLVVRNRASAIAIADANRVDIYNNTLVDNGIGLSVQDDERINTDQKEKNSGNTWISSSISFVNNLVGNYHVDNDEPLVWARDFADNRRAGEMFLRSGHNLYHLNGRHKPAVMFKWWSNGTPISFTTLKSFQKHTGMDLNSVSFYALDPFMHFVDPGNDNFLLKPNSPGWRMGTEIPNDLAEAAGIGLIRRPNIGLLFDP